MEKVINIFLQKLEMCSIKRHIVCPSAAVILKDMSCKIPNGIEIVDERSAGYVATGMCAEAKEPVVIWCANDASFRNLAPSLTEAYYRKLPLLVIALSCANEIDQTMNPNDILRYKFEIPRVVTNETCENIITNAIGSLSATVLGPCLLYIVNQYIFAEQETTFKDIDRGKDGKLAKLIGAAIVDPAHLKIGKFSKEELMYDLNMFGNRHISNNTIVINTEGEECENAIFDFAKRMNWQCCRLSRWEYEQMSQKFMIGEHPQYIEIIK